MPLNLDVRFESSVEAFRISVRRALEFLETFESYILDGKIMDSSSFQKAMRFLAREDEEDDATPPGSRSDELDTKVEAQDFLVSLPTLDAKLYDLKRLHNDLRKDVDALRAIWQDIVTLTPERDAKLNQLKHLLLNDLKGQKVLIFTSYKDTARYLWSQAGQTWDVEGLRLAHMDSSTDTRERAKILARFAPRANKREDLVGGNNELDVLISTDVLSEGQNLQDCGVLINYDLHWNPTRMIQRAGRIDRLGTDFQRLWIMNMFPEDGLEKLLGLVESLAQKIADIDRNGLLDASILGEAVHPQNFNTLRRIAAEDGRVLMEQEQFSELVSSEFLLQNLKGLLNSGLRQSLEELPDGIHSGLGHQGAKGVFFAFTAPDKSSTVSLPGGKPGRKHYWRYIDLFTDQQGGRIEENRYILTNLIQCHPDTMRVVPLDGSVDIFALQEKVIASILQASIEQRAIAEAPKLLDPIQQTVIVTIRSYVHSPQVSRKEVVQALQRLRGPLPGVYLKALRKAYEAFLLNNEVRDLLTAIQNLDASVRTTDGEESAQSSQSTQPAQSKMSRDVLKREDLRLICFEYIWH